MQSRRVPQIQAILIEIGMTLSWRHEPNHAMTMLVIIQTHKSVDLRTRCGQGAKRLWPIGRPVFPCFERQFRTEIVVAHARTAQ